MTELAGTRDYYGKTLVELGKENPDIVVLDADLSSSTRTGWFAKEFPDRFFNAGIAEQNCIGMAAGLSLMGKIVFASSFAMFISGRPWEQIRNSIAYPRLNVKIGATHAGITVGEDGATHQALEDISIMRAIPYMNVLVPADAIETAQMVRLAAKVNGPFYIRMSRSNTPLIFKGTDYQFELGKNKVLTEGKDVTIFVCGIMVSKALEAVEELKKEKIFASVVNVSCISPIDMDTIVKMAKKTGAAVTVEEHSILGGMGSAVAEILVKHHPVPVEMLGIEGVFGESGKPDDLLTKHNLNVNGIINKVKKVLARK
ncbi:MAG: transketolase family protein [Candidatus Margulisbacteria bacterium]|nr:transketolase family protein [Candidatus Margulisiibacteriota bacterium]